MQGGEGLAVTLLVEGDVAHTVLDVLLLDEATLEAWGGQRSEVRGQEVSLIPEPWGQVSIVCEL